MDVNYAGTKSAMNQAYAGSMNQQAAPVAPANPSCFGNIEDVCGTCSSMASRVERIVNRLSGIVPVDNPNAGQIQGEPNGIFDAADRQARDIRDSMDRIAQALNRLEKSLP